METDELTDQQQIIELLSKQERHLKFFSTVLSGYLILQGVIIFGFLVWYLISKFLT